MQLRDYLAQKGERPAEFARRTGLTHTTISRILNGRRSAGRRVIEAIHDATDGKVTANDLVLFGRKKPDDG